MSLSEDALVAVCLCTRLGRGERVAALDVREWTDLVMTLHRDRQATPSALLDDPAALGLESPLVSRVEGLLRGLASVGMEVERLESNGVWVLTRGDDDYPRIWKRKLGASSPPVLFGAGRRSALAAELVAIVGSRDVDEAGGRFARELAELCAREGCGVVSGGAPGVDRIAMEATLATGGFGVEVLADSLERAIAMRVNREAILAGRLTILTPYLPGDPYSAERAIGRNRLVYALASLACMVATDRGRDWNRGSTWSGASEAMREDLAPVFVRTSDDAPDGNRVLAEQGAIAIRVPLATSIEEVFAG